MNKSVANFFEETKNMTPFEASKYTFLFQLSMLFEGVKLALKIVGKVLYFIIWVLHCLMGGDPNIGRELTPEQQMAANCRAAIDRRKREAESAARSDSTRGAQGGYVVYGCDNESSNRRKIFDDDFINLNIHHTNPASINYLGDGGMSSGFSSGMSSSHMGMM